LLKLDVFLPAILQAISVSNPGTDVKATGLSDAIVLA